MDVEDTYSRFMGYRNPVSRIRFDLPYLDGWFPPCGKGDHFEKRPMENDVARDAYEAFYRIVSEIKRF